MKLFTAREINGKKGRWRMYVHPGRPCGSTGDPCWLESRDGKVYMISGPKVKPWDFTSSFASGDWLYEAIGPGRSYMALDKLLLLETRRA